MNLDDPLAVAYALVFGSDPFTIGLHKTASWVPHEGRGVRLLMNFGIAKEQMDALPPFGEIFSTFSTKLDDADLVIAAGYSFRDGAINRMLLESLKKKHRPIVIIDPQVIALLRDAPVVAGLHTHGVLV